MLTNDSIEDCPGESRADNEDTEPEIKSGCCRCCVSPCRCGCGWFSLTVEPVILFYFIGLTSYIQTLQQYSYAVFADQYGFNSSISEQNCSINQSTQTSHIQDQVEAESSEFMLFISMTSIIPSFFSTMFLGHYSDIRGRRKAIIPPLIGGVIRSLLTLFVVHFKLNLYILLVGTVMDAFSGGVITEISACLSYISDISTESDRSLRLLVLELSLAFGVAVSSIGAGYIIQDYGFFWAFMLSFAAFTLIALFTAVLLKETVVVVEDANVFSMSHLIETWHLYSRDTDSKRRWKLWMLLIIISLVAMSDIGASDVTTYFLIEYPLCFTSTMVGFYGALSFVSPTLLSLVFARLFSGCLSDTMLIVLGCMSDVAAKALLATAHTTFIVYSATLVVFGSGLIAPLCRSLSSKLVYKNELGALFAAITFGQQLMQALGRVVFNLVYAHTVSVFAGTVFVISAGILLLTLLIAIWLHVGVKKQNRSEIIQVPYGQID